MRGSDVTSYWNNTGLNLLPETKFHRFLSGKSVCLNSKLKIRELCEHIFFHCL